MSSTEADAMARAIFNEVIAPARDPLVFPRAADPSAASYFTAPPRTTMKPGDFECPPLASTAAFAEALEALWREEGRPSLAPLPARLRALADELAKELTAEDADVSPFIYAMF